MVDDITFFAETNFRDQKRRFGIKALDRRKHIYIIGKTGMGKTTVLENMVIQDIQAGRGVGVVDPHGEFAERVLDFVPEERLKDVVYFNPADLQFPMAFNSMESILPEQRHLVASGLLGVFKKIWPDVWSPRMEYLLSNSILALLEIPGSTLLGINRMFSDKEFRKSVVTQLTDPVVRAFWEKEYAQYQERFATEASAAIQNKVGQFISNPLIRNIVGQEKSAVDIRRVMDEGKIFIMNLSKGKVGEENARLLGAMLITKIYLSAMTRVDVPEEERRDFYLYVDEFQNFATESFANILAEARKYRLNLVLAHQYVAQMEEEVADAVFGNVGTMIAFRVGAPDAELLEKEFSPEFMIQDLVNLGFAQIYLKLMIEGIASRPFSAITLAPFPKPGRSHRQEIIKFSQERYGSKAEEVKEKIARFHGLHFESSGPSPTSFPVSPSRGDFSAPRKPDRKLYEAHCIIDGSTVLVPFIPDGRRPVYCEKHLEMLKQGATFAVPGRRPERQESGPRRPESSSARPESRRYEQFSRPAPPPIRPRFESRPAVRFQEHDRPLSLNALKPKEALPEESAAERPAPIKEPAPKTGQIKKEVDLAGLRKVLTESLKDVPREAEERPQQKKERSGGVLKPGEKITFE